MIENENGELVPNPAYNRAEDGDCYCCGIKWDPFPLRNQVARCDSHPSNKLHRHHLNKLNHQQHLPLNHQLLPPMRHHGAPAYEQPAYSPQQTEIPMAQMQDWSAPQSYGGYNDGPVKRSRAICIIL